MREHQISARVVRPAALSAQEVAAWETLSATVPGLSSPFLSVHYARAVAATGINVRVCVLSEQGAIRGFLPYQYTSRFAAWAKAAEPVGGTMTDYVGLIAVPDFAITPAQLLQYASLNYFNFTHLDETQLQYGLAGEQPRIGLRVRLVQGAEHPIEALCGGRNKYVKDTERRMRQLANEVGPICFTFDQQDQRQEALSTLISHKRAQYRRTGVPDALADAWKLKLLQQLSTYRFDSCRSILSILSAGEQWVAMHFGLIGHGVLQYWLPVYNPEFSRYAPGRLLLHSIINAADRAGIHTIDRGEGDTPSKRDLANEEHRFFRGIWDNRSMASYMTHGLQRMKWRLGI